MKYAANTSVPIDRSKAEIEKELARFGATGFLYGWQDSVFALGFQFNSKTYRFQVPKYEDEQDTKVHFRALLLYIKSMLVWVADGYASFEEVFLPHMITHKGDRVCDVVLPQLADSKIPKLLLM